MVAQFLMTDPAHYRVGYEINPWMRPAAWSADPAGNGRAALAAWTGLKAAIEAEGAGVRVLAGLADQPDMVFPANSAVVLDRMALVARFRHPERSGEEPGFLAAFEALKAEGALDQVSQIEVFQEGAGDCIWDAGRRLFWAGDGPRSSPDAAPIIARHFGREVVRLPLASQRYYHLDTCFCPLPGGEILYYPPALTPEALRRLRDIVPAALLIEATRADAEGFCVNAVALDRTIVMARPTPDLRRRLSARGYRVVGLDLAPFILSGGGAFCMTLRLDLQSARTLVPSNA
ncbi:MAG TPA: arginine deiminase-related protein [Caulobacteraceae bacterium]|jgi:N-dimethylarginine dimethylaminohydrolase|nr:arginine deiminase-related protein [Caulobacteraceae bacterium]